MTKTKIKTVYKIKWKNLIFILLLLIGTAILMFGVFRVATFIKDNSATNKVIKEIEEKIEIEPLVDDDHTKTIPPDSKLSKFDIYWDYIKLGLLDVDMSSLKKMNSSAIGYIEVKGTDFAYPVVENNEDFYKSHSFNKKENTFGWIYLDKNSGLETLSTNTIILGNKTYSKNLMASLNTVFKSKWQEDDDNFIIKYSTSYYSTLWQIISIYETKSNDPLKAEFSETELQEFITNSIEQSSFKFKADAKTTDKFLTLTTNSKGTNKVVLAKLIKIRET